MSTWSFIVFASFCFSFRKFSTLSIPIEFLDSSTFSSFDSACLSGGPKVATECGNGLTRFLVVLPLLCCLCFWINVFL